MKDKDYVIQSRDEDKGRAFSATCLGVATADGLWGEDRLDRSKGAIRPVWGMFAGTVQQLRSFHANLKGGRKAEPVGHNGGDNDRLEFLRSSKFLTIWQHTDEGSALTLYHPDLFRLDPGLVDPAGLNFLLFVPSEWAARQTVDVQAAVRHARALFPTVDPDYISSLAVTAYLFAAYLDRRTRCPLVADGRFYLQLLVAALDQGFASLPGDDIKYNRSRDEWGHNQRHGFNAKFHTHSFGDRITMGALGFDHMISFAANHSGFEQFLAEQVTLYFARVKGKARRGKVDPLSVAAGAR